MRLNCHLLDWYSMEGVFVKVVRLYLVVSEY